MEGMSVFQSQLSSIMEKLVVSAVTEINQLMCEYCAVLRVQLSGEKSDNSPPRLHRPGGELTQQHGKSDAATQIQAERMEREGTTEEEKERTSALVDCKIEPSPVACSDPPEVHPSLRVTPPAHSATHPQLADFCPLPAGRGSEFCSELSEDSKDPHSDFDPSVEMQCRLSLSPGGAQFSELGFHIKREAESPDLQIQDEDLNLSFELQQGILGQSCTDSAAFPVNSNLPDTQMPTCFSSLQLSGNHHRPDMAIIPESSTSGQLTADRSTSCRQRNTAQNRIPEPYTCDFCGKAFPYLSTMKGHRLSHTRERSHVCGHCGKTFIRRSHLNRHKMLHVGIKPFTCQVCGRCFFQRAQLGAHMVTHNL